MGTLMPLQRGSPILSALRRLPLGKQVGTTQRSVRQTMLVVAEAKPDFDGEETARKRQPTGLSSLPRVSKALLARCAAAVFALGFVDAGYSGDWSRINVISKENEELLQYAAFLVVPLCTFFIFSISDVEKSSPP